MAGINFIQKTRYYSMSYIVNTLFILVSKSILVSPCGVLQLLLLYSCKYIFDTQNGAVVQLIDSLPEVISQSLY